jgi:CubicO group peptidase (beta-lactamase class C family)
MRHLIPAVLLLPGFLMGTSPLAISPDPPSRGLIQCLPEAVGLLSLQLKHLDEAVNAAIQAGEIPGAVVLVARHGRSAYLKAFGKRALIPAAEPMTTDTIFDVASLTKVMATTPAIMLLLERGLIRLDDKVKRYLPKFAGGGKDGITVRQLLTHYSGLPPDFDLARPWSGHDAAMEELWRVPVQSEPGKEFVYSDINFIALGELVRAVSGRTLDDFAREEIYVPLGMNETTFNPPAEWRPRIAPTEFRSRASEPARAQEAGDEGDMLRGAVHDPTAQRMAGVAGHAGLFSSVHDVAIYGQTLLNRGSYQGKRLLSPQSVLAMTSPQSPRTSLQVRGLGWDLDSVYSAPRGDLFAGGYGHTGFTGTSIWIHPGSDSIIVLLTNRVHPDGKGDVTRLRTVIANIVAASISDLR